MYSIHIWVLEGVLQCMLSADAVPESLGLLSDHTVLRDLRDNF